MVATEVDLGITAAYLLAGVLTVAAIRRFVRAAARSSDSARDPNEWVRRVRRDPRRVFSIVFSQTFVYLQLLLRRNDNPEVERLRRIAISIGFVALILLFVVPIRWLLG